MIHYFIIAVEAPERPKLRFNLASGEAVDAAIERMTEAEFKGMNPVAQHREMQAVLPKLAPDPNDMLEQDERFG